jgi:DNA-binding CsgD family transcriptional regulator/tetratricopeptide (TPR) repeat protein
VLARHAERTRLDQVLERIREGHSSTLLLEGAAGVGKTTLLRYIAASAEDQGGLRALTVSGVQSEVDFAYAALHQLCRPLMDALPDLPAPQRQALEITFGLRSGPPPGPFLVGLAALSLLAEASASQPLLCVVDDAQWLDEASALVIGFVARRLEAEPVGFVIAARTPAELTHFRGVTRLLIVNLSAGDANDLLSSLVPGHVDARARDRILSETGGNPLAIVESVRALDRAEMAAGIPVAPRPARPSELEAHFQRQAAALPPETQLLLLVAAASPSSDVDSVHAAAAALGLNGDALMPAVHAGLLESNHALQFRHPLVRSAVYRSAAPEDLRAAHRALAETFENRSDADLLVWHRARATHGVDESVATELALAAERAIDRGGTVAGATFLQEALRLTADPPTLARRQLRLAQIELAAGLYDEAASDLGTATGGALPPELGGDAKLTEARIVSARERGGSAVPLLLEAAAALASGDPQTARTAYLEAFSAALFGGKYATGDVLRTVATAWHIAPAEQVVDSPDQLLLDALTSVILNGHPQAWEALRGALATLASPEATVSTLTLWIASVAAAAAWDLDTWEPLARRMVDQSRGAGNFSDLPIGLSSHAFVHLFQGRIDAASDEVSEMELVTSTTGGRVSPYGAIGTAAVQGREAEVYRLLNETVPDAEQRSDGTGIAIAYWAAALLNNSLGRHETAHMWAVRADKLHHSLHATSGWALVERVESSSRMNDLTDARVALDLFAELAIRSGTDWALGVLARCRALCSTSDDETEAGFLEALERLGRTQANLDYARACLMYGEWLRRRRRLTAARSQLRDAHDLFRRMGAAAFAERAARELAAAGSAVPTRKPDAQTTLTPQEMRVARLASQGMTNSEVAARMFLSPRTVESHLGKIFSKLQITSRHQLPDIR